MGVEISVKLKVDGLRSELRQLSAGLQDRAIANAVNETAKNVRTTIARDIVKTYNLTRPYVDERLQIRAASRKGISIEAKLGTKGRRAANLIRYIERKVSLAEGRRRAGKGLQSAVFVQIKRGSAPRLVRGAFIGNQGRTVFRRLGRGRLPIEALTTLDVPQAMFRRKGVEVMKQAVQERFEPNLRRQIQRLGRTQYVKVRA